jgi:hypothetical protein
MGHRVRSSPALSGDTLYIGSNDLGNFEPGLRSR